jgi:hypothetical protein
LGNIPSLRGLLAWRRLRIYYPKSNRIAGFRQGKDFSHGLGGFPTFAARLRDDEVAPKSADAHYPGRTITFDLPDIRPGVSQRASCNAPTFQNVADVTLTIMLRTRCALTLEPSAMVLVAAGTIHGDCGKAVQNAEKDQHTLMFLNVN